MVIWELIILVSLVTAATVIKLWHLGGRAYVFDEAIHVSIAKSFVTNGFSWQVEREIGSVHMPLQYFVMGWWWQLSSYLWPTLSEEVVFRLPSVIMSSLTIPLVYLICRRFGLLTAVSASLFFAFHPYILVYTRFASLDFPGLFWLTLGILVYLQATTSPAPGTSRWAWLLAAGFLFGVAGMTKAYSLLVLAPIVLHSLLQGWPRRWGLTFTVQQGGPVVAVCLATVAGLSWLLAHNPILLYKGFEELLGTLYTLPSEMVNRPELRWFGFIRDEALGVRQVLQTIWSHLGAGAFLIALAGAFHLVDEDRRIGRSGWFFILFMLVGMVVFAPFHWPRYLLVMGSIIPIIFAFGVKDTYRRLGEVGRKLVQKQSPAPLNSVLAVGLAVATVASLFPLPQIPKMYRVQMVDDWVYGDGLKEAALYLKGGIGSGDWVMTNGHYTILSHYGGFPAHFYMGFGPQLRVYQIYNYQTKAPDVVDVKLSEEEKLKYLVVDNTPSSAYTFLFQPQVGFSYALVNMPLLDYIANYFEPIASFQDGIVQVYKRNSRNYHNPLPQPEVWVGEGGAGWKENLANYNGWILGEGWGQPRAVPVTREAYWARPALREGNRFADFMLPIRDTGQSVTLEIMFQDVGTGQITIASLLREVKAGEQERFLRPLGQIQLTNSGAIKTATIPLPSVWYHDASTDVPGHQQQFSFFTQGSAIQVIKVAIKQ